MVLQREEEEEEEEVAEKMALTRIEDLKEIVRFEEVVGVKVVASVVEQEEVEQEEE